MKILVTSGRSTFNDRKIGRIFGKMKNERLQITFSNDFVVIRTIDHQDYPIDVWRFDMKDLSKNERIFIENMLSMSKSMISEKEKTENNEKSNTE